MDIKAVSKLNKKLEKRLKQAEEDIKAGRCKSWEEVKVELEAGLKLREDRIKRSFLWFLYYRVEHGYYILKNDYTPAQIYRDIKYTIQRAIHGWSVRDTWDAYSYISKVNADMIEHLRDNKVGYPADMTEKKWDDILSKIVKSFRTAEKVSKGEIELYHPKTYKFWKKEEYPVMSKKEYKEMQKGFKLFIKYFFCLWD